MYWLPIRRQSFTGTPGTTYVLEWTITNGVVCTPSVDQVTIKLDANPSPAARQVRSDLMFHQCDLSGEHTGNRYRYLDGREWSRGKFCKCKQSDDSLQWCDGTSYNLRWTISNGVCTSTNDNVQITFNTPPTVAKQVQTRRCVQQCDLSREHTRTRYWTMDDI